MLRYLGEYFYHYACTEYAWYRLTEVQWDPSKSSSKSTEQTAKIEQCYSQRLVGHDHYVRIPTEIKQTSSEIGALPLRLRPSP